MLLVSQIYQELRTFGTLLSSGVPILQALQITRDTLSNGLFVKAMGNVHDSVRDGEAMAVQMERSLFFRQWLLVWSKSEKKPVNFLIC